MTMHVVPNASTEGYTLGVERNVEAHLSALRDFLKERRDASTRAYNAALGEGPDRALYPVTSRVRPTITAILKAHEARVAAARSAPGRRFMNQAGIRDEEEQLAAQLDAQLEAAGRSFAAQLDRIATELASKRDALRNHDQDNDTTVVALNLQALLEKSTPAHGIGEMIAALNGVITGAENASALAACLPLWRSLHDRPGTAWSKSPELLEVIRAAEELTDGGWEADVLDARVGRAEHVRGMLDVFVGAARDPGDRNDALQYSAQFGLAPDGETRSSRALLEARDAQTGAYALFPELEPLAQPSRGRSSVERLPLSEYSNADVRRVGVSAEKRALDAAARAEQADGEEE